jgi:hypothetical protein
MPAERIFILIKERWIIWIRREDLINVSMHSALCTCRHECAPTGIPLDCMAVEVHAYSVYCSDVYKTTGTGQHTGQPRLQVLTAKNLLFCRYPNISLKAIYQIPFHQIYFTEWMFYCKDISPNGHFAENVCFELDL